ncbi:Dam family site-specific DNA-(adenine-N6)-methyltransferase (plasmid) [Priestia megaterium]|uniref:Dam family site-specific DNA-(adenine-N6)-methyltransferase n=1 Tax=Priestia megaterium TaxID=1404 RepID=UPI00196B2791|nr:Dam family site-specific DNA-(adenine-N6)-methyltransferase [Priestia megaterium]QSF35963.1 Dam family site-specific DNA-(adenine-N6)-methyltransferase [Priestia megaterium]
MLKIQQRRYLGSKAKLLNFISDILKKEKIEYNRFVDLFGGTGVVGHYFNKSSEIIMNDLLYSNYLIHVAFMGDEKVNDELVKSILNEYNSLKFDELPENYFSDNFSNTYFSHKNCKLIGYIREDIERRKKSGTINHREFAYLVTSLMYAMDRIANTVGHYDAYRKKQDDLNREMRLDTLDIEAAELNKGNEIYNMDANSLVASLKSDVVYLDPPYNSRQYSDCYHLLENVAEWKKPDVKGVARKMDRSHRKSKYCMKTAAETFSDLLDKLDTKYILVSYNDMGENGCSRSQARMSDHEIISALERKGRVTVYSTEFKQFTTGTSTKEDLQERIFVCEVGVYSNPSTEDSQLLNNEGIESISTRKGSVKRKTSNKKKYVKSPLNYTGGKYRLLDQIIPYFPKDIENFYDVFSGGANIGINSIAQNTVCIDYNEKVIRIQQLIQRKNFDELHNILIDKIEEFGLSRSYENGYEKYGCESTKGLGSYNKEKYKLLKQMYNTLPISEEKDILLLLLIIYGFNNQIRFNSKGDFNLPVGKRDYNGSVRNNLLRFSEASKEKSITFKVDDFRSLKDIKLSKNDFVYLDPPYLLGTASYNESGGWAIKDETELLEVLDKLDENGIKFALSNVSEHKGQENIYLKNWVAERSHYMHKLNFNYNNSNYQSKAKEKQTIEVLVTNYKPSILIENEEQLKLELV